MVKVLDQTAPALSQERTLNFEWCVVERQWILLGLMYNYLQQLFYREIYWNVFYDIYFICLIRFLRMKIQFCQL